MNMDTETYKKFAKAHAPKSPCLKNCVCAFLVGGAICTFAQLLNSVYGQYLSMSREDAGTLTSVTLIFIAVMLTGFGVFDRIAKYAGGGTLLPITGFANSVASPAIDAKSEGFILGVGAKIFTVAGPVILYGTAASVVWGVIYWACKALGCA
ncbi:MAG: stage V sporulation protein AC [Ruminococcaceae bacterium]|nr:stage V sporulation protein AC [Oscillospiraceae bacterium]